MSGGLPEVSVGSLSELLGSGVSTVGLQQVSGEYMEGFWWIPRGLYEFLELSGQSPAGSSESFQHAQC